MSPLHPQVPRTCHCIRRWQQLVLLFRMVCPATQFPSSAGTAQLPLACNPCQQSQDRGKHLACSDLPIQPWSLLFSTSCCPRRIQLQSRSLRVLKMKQVCVLVIIYFKEKCQLFQKCKYHYYYQLTLPLWRTAEHNMPRREHTHLPPLRPVK